MATVNVWHNRRGKEINFQRSVPIGIGAAMEGVVGKQLFQLLRSIVNMDTVVGMVQSMILGLLILATHIYVRIKDRIPTKDIWGSLVSGCIGAAFGVLSAFLGIGGEPMNLAMFDYFFLMDTKQASINSILILSLF